MRIFYCQQCDSSEQVSDDCDRMTHWHNGHLYALREIPQSLDYFPNKRKVMNMIEAIEFEEGKTYMVLFDPFSIDGEQLEKLVGKYMNQNIKIIFVPCNFSVTQSGFVSEVVTLDSLEVMEQWLKEKKEQMRIQNYKEVSQTYCPIHRIWDFCSYEKDIAFIKRGI